MVTTSSRTVFYGFGAYVGSITGVTTCSWWPDDPKGHHWVAGAQVPVDLAMTPKAVLAGTIKIDDVQTDDHRADGGYNVIGPRWPGGAMIGLCWLSETYYRSLKNPPPRHPPSAAGDAHDYELTSILYWDKGSYRRYQGYHAKIVGTNGPLSRVQVWFAGSSRVTKTPLGEWWIDLATEAHPVDPVATQISAKGVTEGALFLDSKVSSGLFSVGGPKRPVLGGAF
jgi:hypothetical protein